jgi:hypothetical protein
MIRVVPAVGLAECPEVPVYFEGQEWDATKREGAAEELDGPDGGSADLDLFGGASGELFETVNAGGEGGGVGQDAVLAEDLGELVVCKGGQ